MKIKSQALFGQWQQYRTGYRVCLRIMLRRITDTAPYSLIPLLAILFIAVGMPLLHPVLHSHLEHHHLNGGCGDGHLPAISDKDQAHKCPTCDFLATSQLHVTVLDRIVTHNEAVCYLLFTNQTFWGMICPSPTEPRAPPVFTSL